MTTMAGLAAVVQGIEAITPERGGCAVACRSTRRGSPGPVRHPTARRHAGVGVRPAAGPRHGADRAPDRRLPRDDRRGAGRSRPGSSRASSWPWRSAVRIRSMLLGAPSRSTTCGRITAAPWSSCSPCRGRGTRWLAERRARDVLDVTGPLGRPFPVPQGSGQLPARRRRLRQRAAVRAGRPAARAALLGGLPARRGDRRPGLRRADRAADRPRRRRSPRSTARSASAGS